MPTQNNDGETRTPWEKGIIRVFLSYSHEDQELARQIVDLLERLGLVVLYDKMIRPGSAFSDEIKGMITHAHIFMPLITENARSRPWVHQEIGYAQALNIPVLPISTGDQPGEMIASYQAIRFHPEKIPDLGEELVALDLDNFVKPKPAPLRSLIEIADWPEKRAELMGHAARRVLEMGHRGQLLQRAGLSSFCIPDVDIEDRVWKDRDGRNPRSDFYHHCLRAERHHLEIHARARGCDLLIDPEESVTGGTAQAKRVRLDSLINFLESVQEGEPAVRVVCSPIAKQANTTIIGEWVSAETRFRLPGEGWRQTVFNWHAPTVRLAREKFQILFDSLLVQQFGDAKVAPLETRHKALAKLHEARSQVEGQAGKKRK